MNYIINYEHYGRNTLKSFPLRASLTKGEMTSFANGRDLTFLYIHLEIWIVILLFLK